MAQDTKQRAIKRPGTRFFQFGTALVVYAAFLCIVGLSTHVAPTPGVWALLVFGLVLLAVGFCKRLLAAVEK